MTSVQELVDIIEGELRASANSDRAAHERRYLRSDLEFLGASVPVVRRAAV